MKSELLLSAEKAISKAIESSLLSYNSPLVLAINDALKSEKESLQSMASEAVNELMSSCDFKIQIKSEMKAKLAKVIISKFGGEVEKTVNTLRQDPTTRAKITLAIDNMMSEILGVKP